MKALIAIPSCARDRHNRVPRQRELLKGYDHFYFYGAGNSYSQHYPFGHKDEVFLPVRDDWEALPEKCQQMFMWALDHDYDYVFKTDTDTFIHPDRLMSSGFENHDYTGLVGSMVLRGKMGDCCGGGAGYWLSRKAMICYISNYDATNTFKEGGWQKNEDWCLFKILNNHSDIRPHHDTRYWDLRLGPVPDESTNITVNEWRGE